MVLRSNSGKTIFVYRHGSGQQQALTLPRTQVQGKE